MITDSTNGSKQTALTGMFQKCPNQHVLAITLRLYPSCRIRVLVDRNEFRGLTLRLSQLQILCVTAEPGK